MQTQWLQKEKKKKKAKVGNFMFPVAVDQCNEDVRFWHKLQREKPALLSVWSPHAHYSLRRMYSTTKEDTDM